MELIRVQTKSQTVKVSQRIGDDGTVCGGWEAVNQGTATAYIDGYAIAPGEGLNRMSGVGTTIWESAIDIQITPGAEVRLTRALYVGISEFG